MFEENYRDSGWLDYSKIPWEGLHKVFVGGFWRMLGRVLGGL